MSIPGGGKACPQCYVGLCRKHLVRAFWGVCVCGWTLVWVGGWVHVYARGVVGRLAPCSHRTRASHTSQITYDTHPTHVPSHPQLQDHGARERALLESKAELQKRLYESMIKPKVRL